ncbi:hypothetical protein CB1_000377013 [Camelus ferus]|nr:hypothetical protein CB1_000377013 [Camelus ferus]
MKTLKPRSTAGRTGVPSLRTCYLVISFQERFPRRKHNPEGEIDRQKGKGNDDESSDKSSSLSSSSRSFLSRFNPEPSFSDHPTECRKGDAGASPRPSGEKRFTQKTRSHCDGNRLAFLLLDFMRLNQTRGKQRLNWNCGPTPPAVQTGTDLLGLGSERLWPFGRGEDQTVGLGCSDIPAEQQAFLGG